MAGIVMAFFLLFSRSWGGADEGLDFAGRGASTRRMKEEEGFGTRGGAICINKQVDVIFGCEQGRKDPEKQ